MAHFKYFLETKLEVVNSYILLRESKLVYLEELFITKETKGKQSDRSEDYAGC